MEYFLLDRKPDVRVAIDHARSKRVQHVVWRRIEDAPCDRDGAIRVGCGELSLGGSAPCFLGDMLCGCPVPELLPPFRPFHALVFCPRLPVPVGRSSVLATMFVQTCLRAAVRLRSDVLVGGTRKQQQDEDGSK